tara:strand:+ start:2322 stop:2558 length:237 start_codon:yes stop_codon:yes gene_type:complete
MRYLLPFILIISGCRTIIKTVDHPIDPVKAEKLVNAVSPVLSVNLWYVSIMTLIVAIILVFAWSIGWRKNQKREADSS